MFLLFFQDVISFWSKIAEQGIAIAVLALILFFVIVLVVKILPTWERVKTAQAEATKAQAISVSEQASALNRLANVVKDVAIEQRRATDTVLILQRVNANESQNILHSVELVTDSIQTLNERMDTFEKMYKE